MTNDFHGIAGPIVLLHFKFKDNPNARFKTYETEFGERRIGIFTMKRKIHKGEEILVQYGHKYNLHS